MVNKNKQFLNDFLSNQNIKSSGFNDVGEEELDSDTTLNISTSSLTLIYFNNLNELNSKLNKKVDDLDDSHKQLISFDNGYLAKQFGRFNEAGNTVVEILDNTIKYINDKFDLNLYFKHINPKFEVVLNKSLDGVTSNYSHSGFLGSYLIRSANEDAFARSPFRTTVDISRRLRTLNTPMYPKFTFNEYNFKGENSESKFLDVSSHLIGEKIADYYLHLNR